MRLKLDRHSFMIIAGILAAIVILSSQTLFYQTQANLKVTTEQAADDATNFVDSPADAVTGNAIEIQDQTPSEAEKVFDSRIKEFKKEASKILISYFKVLLEVIISPNAP